MDKGTKVQYLVAAAVSIASVSTGVSISWGTPVIPKFHNNETSFQITEEQISWVAAMSSLGYVAGCVATILISDRFGRRTTILGSALPVIVGTIIILNTATVWWLYVARFLWGVCTGMLGAVTPIYLAEIASKDIRGRLSAANRFMLSFGNWMVMTVGPFVSYQTLSYMLLVLPICYFGACWFVPESPYYLLKNGNVDAARASLMKLSGNRDEKVFEDRLSTMRSDVRKEMLRSSSITELFTGKQYRRALIVVTGLKLTQICSGSLAIQQYLGRITQECNINVSNILIIFGAVKFVSGILSSIIVDKIGRRPLLMHSFYITGIALTIVGIYFLIPPTTANLGYIPLTAVIISAAVGTIGFDTLCVFIPAELFPINIKSVANTFLHILGGLLTFLTVKCYQQMKDLSGLTGVFWFFAAFCFMGAVFTYFIVPETRAKSLREIQIELQGNIYDEAGEELNQSITKREGEKVVIALENNDCDTFDQMHPESDANQTAELGSKERYDIERDRETPKEKKSI